MVVVGIGLVWVQEAKKAIAKNKRKILLLQ
jgi:hypothetical protein